VVEQDARDPSLLGPLPHISFGIVGDDHSNLGLQFPSLNGLGNSFEIAAIAGSQNAKDPRLRGHWDPVGIRPE
jgi:hypothetical protein